MSSAQASGSGQQQQRSPAHVTNKNEYEVTMEDGSKLKIILTWWDKIMRKLLSRAEFEARLLEKIEKAKEAHRRTSQKQQEQQNQ